MHIIIITKLSNTLQITIIKKISNTFHMIFKHFAYHHRTSEEEEKNIFLVACFKPQQFFSMDFDVIITKERSQYFHIFCSLTRYLLPYRFSIGLFCNFALQLPFYGINCIKYMQTRHFFTFDTIAENGISGQYCPAAALASF